jgi:hypothetical protein
VWYPDVPALVIDLLFWANVGVLSSVSLEVWNRCRETEEK